MKLKNLLTASVLLMSVSAHAQGDKTGNGLLMSDGDKKILVDLAQSPEGRCEILDPAEFFTSLGIKKELDGVLNDLQKTHPYMGYRLRREVYTLGWCLTNKLVPLKNIDEDSIATSYVSTVRVAIRDIPGRKVYIAKDEIKGLELNSQVMTIIHEAMHSFITERANRTTNIRTAVHAIYQNHLDSAKNWMSSSAITRMEKNFNSMLGFTGFVKPFERVSVGYYFDRFLRISKQRDPQSLAEMDRYLKAISILAFQPDQIIGTLMNEFGQAWIWSLPTLRKETNLLRPSPRYLVPETLRFGQVYSQFVGLSREGIVSKHPIAYRMVKLGQCEIGFGGRSMTGYYRWNQVEVNLTRDGDTLLTMTHKNDNRYPEKELNLPNYQKFVGLFLNLLAQGNCDESHPSGRMFFEELK